jgi:hypothetical protein
VPCGGPCGGRDLADMRKDVNCGYVELRDAKCIIIVAESLCAALVAP